MPDSPTPWVNGQVVGSPALQASKSISSLAPAATTIGLDASMATPGSFCLFCANGDGGLPTETSVSAWANAGVADKTSTAAATAATTAWIRLACTWSSL